MSMRRAIAARRRPADADERLGRYAVGEDVAERGAHMAALTASSASAAAGGRAMAPAVEQMEPASAAVGVAAPALERLRRLRRARDMDWPMLVAVVCLCALGLLLVFSVSQAIAPTDPWLLLRRQGLALALGLLALVVAARTDYHRWRWLARWGYALALGLLALTLVFGRAANGAQRWLGGAISFQPSEPAKLALALALASWFARVGPDVRTARRGLLPWLGMTGALAALTLAQRDMGTTVVIVTLALAVYFTAGARWRHLLALLAGGALTLGALALLVSYRRARLAAFLDPLPPGCRDASSYQVCQGLLSLGSGGVVGAGLGASVQKAGYLPFPQTDSIYAVLGGELGLLGCALTLGLLGVVVWRGYRAGQRAPERFGALLACGLTTWLAAQAAINVGGVVAAIPFTGVPLPFISYGGAALVSDLAAVGVLLNIAAQGAPLRQSWQTWRPRAEDVEDEQDEAPLPPLAHATEVSERPELGMRTPRAGTPLATPQLARTSSGTAPLRDTFDPFGPLGEEYPIS